MAGSISGNVAPFLMSGDFIIGDHHDQDHHHRVMVMVGADTTSAGGMLMTEEDIHRLLQDNQRGRTVLTVLYLLVLGMCFIVPVFYYFRMSCDERYQRRLRELELAGITQALEQSQNAHREESRAARRKFREERRARINQLFAPVKMVRTSTGSSCTILFISSPLLRRRDVSSCCVCLPVYPSVHASIYLLYM